MERFYCCQREKGIKGFHAVEALVVIFEEVKLLSGQQDSILYVVVLHCNFCFVARAGIGQPSTVVNKEI